MDDEDFGGVFITKLKQVFPTTEPISTNGVHNFEVCIRRRRVTRIRDRVVSDDALEDFNLRSYIPPSVFRCFDTLAIAVKRRLCETLNFGFDDGTVNGVAEVVFNGLKDGVCDAVQKTVVVVVVEQVEIEDLPDDQPEEDELGFIEEDVYDGDDDYNDLVNQLLADAEEEVVVAVAPVRFEVDAGSEGIGEQCAICWDVFVAGTGVMKLSCDHMFHGACIGAWFERRWNCPMCRKLVIMV